MLAGIERTADAIGGAHRRQPSAPSAWRTVLGPHVPSPLGRLLRMPAVPFSVLADPPFAVVEDIDVARAFVAAAERRLDRAGQRRRQRRDHRAAGGPPRAAHPDPAGRSGLGDRPRLISGAARRADPRPRRWRRCTAAASPTTVGMEELLGFTSPTTTVEVDRPAVRVADRRAHPGPAGGGVMSTPTYEARVITLPVERTLTAARARRRRAAPARSPPVGTWPSTTGAATRARRRRCRRSAALRWNTVVGGAERLPGAGRRADRRQRPPLRAGADLRGVGARRRATGRPVRFVGRPDIAPVGAARSAPRRAARPARRGRRRAARRRARRASAPRRRCTRAASGAVDHALIGAAVATPGRRCSRRPRRARRVGRSARVEVGAGDPARRRRARSARPSSSWPTGRAAHPAAARRVRRHADRHAARLAAAGGMGGS